MESEIQVTINEVRTAFLDFFKEKGHTIIPSSSLIPHGDPTLLLNTAGMVQIKPYFLGEAVPPSPRLASCQKCFRTTDIESVGDAKHLTFFEMLGNFSVGDYFKKEAINWGWEFVTQRLNIPKERLWITIFLDDEEAFHYWREIGVPAERIVRCGEEDNFWGPAGNTGPCGPCSEIHYDFGEEYGCGKADCGPSCDCERFSEIWNLVFTQYNQDEKGNRPPLPRPNIDTGMGLERMVVVLNGKSSVYETDVFTPLLKKISELSGKKYGDGFDTDNAMRVVVEHSRGIPFLIADGVMPSNEGRGYVLRRLLRRAALFGRTLGLDKPFITEMARTTIEQMRSVYPEIAERQDFILKVIALEEARFSGTLSAGLELLDGIMAGLFDNGSSEIGGEQAFKLYDTYGFPVELTCEIASKSDVKVDMDGFEQAMEKQREKARSAHKFDNSSGKEVNLSGSLGIDTTPFMGYNSLKHKSVIAGIVVDNDIVKSVSEGTVAGIILKNSPFYGEMGGQVGDTGRISALSGQFMVTDTIRMQPNIIVHRGEVAGGELSVGDEVEAEVDAERRLDIARNHTATHLLQLALRQVLGDHVQQRGSLVAPDQFRFDFSHLAAMTANEIEQVQRIVNDGIRRNLPVYAEEMPYKEAVKSGAIALFDEKYGDVVRVLRVGKPPISAELCGGTHISATGEIGFFRIIGESSIGAGLRRIEAVTGRGAETFVACRLSSLEKISGSLGASPDTAEEKLADLLAEMEEERRQSASRERELARIRAESLLEKVEVVNGVNLVVAHIPDSRVEILREMSDFLRDKLKSVVVVLGSVHGDRPVFIAVVTPDLVSKGYKAGDMVKKVAAVTGGGGGGRPDLAQAGGKFKDKIDEALALVKSLI